MKKKNLSFLLNDEVIKIIAIEKFDGKESIVRVGISSEMLSRINQTIKSHKKDPFLKKQEFELSQKFSYEWLKDENKSKIFEEIGYHSGVSSVLYADEKYDSYLFEEVKEKVAFLRIFITNTYIDKSMAVFCTLKVGLCEVSFYANYGNYDFPKSLESLGIEITSLKKNRNKNE